MITPPSIATGDLLLFDEPLTAWEDIRSALVLMEKLRKQEMLSNARIEVYQNSEGQMSLKVTLKSLQELDDYLDLSVRRVLLDAMGESFTVHELEQVSSRVYDHLRELNDIYGYIVLGE